MYVYDFFDDIIGTTIGYLLSEIDKTAPKAKDTKTVASKKNPEVKEKTEKKKTKLSPPWWTAYNKINAMFEADPDIEISEMTGEGSEYTVYLDTPDAMKAFALNEILKTEYNFGNITLNVHIRVTNKGHGGPARMESTYDDYLDALATTPAVVDIRQVVDMFGAKWIVIDFKKEVVQFYNDDLTDFYGNWNGLYTDIANDIFKYNPVVKYTIAVTDE